MKHWRSGRFERERLSSIFRAFAPAHAVDSLLAINLHELWSEGKRLIMLDVDNTIVAWKQEDFSPEVVGWIEHAKKLGFDVCIISNTRRVARLGRITEKLNVQTVRGRFKPSRAMYRLALIKFNRKRHEAVMIGDQMMTDILGANRAGIDAIWVRQMGQREFVPTKINRFFERLLASAVYKALVMPEDGHDTFLDPASQQQLSTAQQILRFGIVGVTSFVIDFLITYFLMKGIHYSGVEQGVVFGRWLQSSYPAIFASARTPDNAAAPIFGGIASFFAMFNSYVFNRAWTFEASGKSRKSQQITRFFAVAIMGNLIAAGIFGFFYGLLHGQNLLLAKALAAGIAAIWNFIGQRTFAFGGSPEVISDWREAPEARFAVIGHPVTHSLSPLMQNAALNSLGIQDRYVAIDVAPGEVGEALDHLASNGYLGINVTVPHKEEVLGWCVEIDPFALKVRAANTIWLDSKSCRNTDAPGFLETLKPYSFVTRKALILGAGGSARAIAAALAEDGWILSIYNRTGEKAVQLAKQVGCSAQDSLSVGESDLIVNMTSASLAGSEIPLEWSEVAGDALIYDLMYGPDSTPFLKSAKAHGLQTLDGLDLLVAQGALSLEWWLGRPVPREVMTEVLRATR